MPETKPKLIVVVGGDPDRYMTVEEARELAERYADRNWKKGLHVNSRYR